jgi:hypothetical protein
MRFVFDGFKKLNTEETNEKIVEAMEIFDL